MSMENDILEKDETFNVGAVKEVVKQCVGKVVDSNTKYNHSLVSQWCSKIVASCIEKLSNLKGSQPYKYVTTCIIMQNNGAGFHTATSCLWDSCDGMYVEKMEGKYLYCITTVYAVSL